MSSTDRDFPWVEVSIALGVGLGSGLGLGYLLRRFESSAAPAGDLLEATKAAGALLAREPPPRAVTRTIGIDGSGCSGPVLHTPSAVDMPPMPGPCGGNFQRCCSGGACNTGLTCAGGWCGLARAEVDSAPWIPWATIVAASRGVRTNKLIELASESSLDMKALVMGKTSDYPGPATKTNRAAMKRTPRDVYDLLAVCPTEHEIDEIVRDFDVTIDARVFNPYPLWPGHDERAWSCATNGQASTNTIIANLVNALRLMKFIQFDEPVPLLGATNLYQWFRDARIRFRVFSDTSNTMSPFGDSTTRTITFPASFLQLREREFMDMRFEDGTSGTGGGVIGPWATIAVIIHEAWHVLSWKGHDCGTTNDSTREYAGAWMAHHYALLWLAEHSGSRIREEHKDWIRRTASDVLRYHICNNAATYAAT